MLKATLFFAAALAATTPALAETFVHQGVTYTYNVKATANGRVITGEDSRGREFVLHVRGSRIDGTVDGTPIYFTKRDVIRSKPTVVSTEIATR